MQRLFYVVCRWLQEDGSKQAERLGMLIKADMETVGFRFEDIAANERHREQLFHEREQLLREKERLEEHKKEIQREREENLRIIQEREQLQKQRDEAEKRLEEERKHAEEMQGENQALEQRRQGMMHQYERLQNERNQILQERQLLFERMQKIEQLQQLQRKYHEELQRIKAEAGLQEEEKEEEKAEEEQNEMPGHYQLPQHLQDNTEPDIEKQEQAELNSRELDLGGNLASKEDREEGKYEQEQKP